MNKSKYQQKKGRQMYGPGCCAHTVKAVAVDYTNGQRTLKELPRFPTERTVTFAG